MFNIESVGSQAKNTNETVVETIAVVNQLVPTRGKMLYDQLATDEIRP